MVEEKETDKKIETEVAEEKETVEVPKEFKDLVASIEKMTVLELSELVKVLEDKFGVSAAAPMMTGAGPAGGDSDEDEGGVVNIELTDGGSSKIAVIKAIRGIVPDLGLREAKEMVESAPKVIKEGVEKAEAEEIKKQLEEAGAKVTFK